MKRVFKKLLGLLRGRDSGTVMINFLVCLPILLLVIGIISQYVLLVNARLTVERAASSAARTAMTALPTDPNIDNFDGVNFVDRSARLTLEPISQIAPGATSAEAQEVGAALRSLGENVPSTFEGRYTMAEDHIRVEWQRLDGNGVPIGDPAQWAPADFARNVGQKILLTVHYDYYLTVPVIGRFMGTPDPTMGMNYITYNSSIVVQLAPGREAQTNAVFGGQ